MLSIKNPILLFALTWLTVVILYNLRLSFLLENLNYQAALYLIFVVLSFILSFLVVLFKFRNVRFLKSGNQIIVSEKANILLKYLFFIWFIFSLFEVYYFRGVPVMAFIGGIDMTYTEWGIPSLHGLLNAVILTISNYALLNFIVSKNKKHLLLLLVCFLWPILLITRQLFMSMSVQALFIYFYLVPISRKAIINAFLIFFLVVIVFGLVGDLRTGASSFIDLVQPTESFPMWLPSGFLWVYIYITSPFNNVNYNIENFSWFNFDLEPVISQLIPSFIRTKIFGESTLKFDLVNENLNVSTMFPNYLFAFGYLGSICFFFLLGCLMSFFYLKTLTKKVNIVWVMISVVFLHDIVFSLFVDFFTSLVFVFQILLHLSFLIKFKSVAN